MEQQHTSTADGFRPQGPILQLAPDDNVGVAIRAIEPGEILQLGSKQLEAKQPIPFGHKVALDPIVKGAKVIKYGAPIGSATCDIAPGEHVHVHNLASDYLPTYAQRGAPDDAALDR